ncbi:right-handed parallel beta-helix repeat-containing protein [candidate division KSB1 bacterium]|nr:right-handed parallel beta-helix repeat-containing protein [candidate division KSB1 bacterium]
MIKKLLLCVTLTAVIQTATGADYNILDYGAIVNEKSTQAIQKAVDVCHENGGGTVLIPAGKFITGTITLKSYVNVHLQQGAQLIASLDLEDYSRSFRLHGMIFCFDATHVSVTGEGEIDARGINFYDPTQNHVYEEYDRNLTRQKQNYQPEGQVSSDGPIKRKPKPGMCLTFYHCSQVSLKDFTLVDTPNWAIRLAYCDDVFIDGLSILNNLLIPNSDGIHCTVSRNVRISNCDIRAGDDAIIVTGFDIDEGTPDYSMRDQKAARYGNKSIYAENYTVTNCHLQSRSSGIRVGYGQHPIRRCIFSNIHIYGSNRGIGIFAHDISDIEELIFSDIIIETRLHNGQWWGNGEPIHISAVSRFEGHSAGKVKNVQFNNIVATGEHGLIFYGLQDSQLENIKLNNIHLRIKNGVETLTYGGNFDLRPAADIKKQIFEHDIPGIYAQYVNGLTINDFSLQWGEKLPSFFTHAIECVDVNELYLERINADKNPACDECEIMKFERTTVKKY